jgi:hypothetical protein
VDGASSHAVGIVRDTAKTRRLSSSERLPELIAYEEKKYNTLRTTFPFAANFLLLTSRASVKRSPVHISGSTLIRSHEENLLFRKRRIQMLVPIHNLTSNSQTISDG